MHRTRPHIAGPPRGGARWHALVVLMGACALATCRLHRSEEEQPADTAEPEAPAPTPAPTTSSPPPPPAPPPPVEAPPGVLVLAIGGLSSTPQQSGATVRAVDRATRALVEGDTALAAAVVGIAELDGELIAEGPPARAERDAAVMDSAGHFGAVCALAGVASPAAAAQLVAGSPQRLLCGGGATTFALAAGLSPVAPPPDAPSTPTAPGPAGIDTAVPGVLSTAAPNIAPEQPGMTSGGGAEQPLGSGGGPGGGGGGGRDADGGGGSGGADEPAQIPAPAADDTLALIVRAADGSYAAVALSGPRRGAPPGYVGAVPIGGAVIFAGSEGAVVVSGDAEARVNDRLARRIYDQLVGGAVPHVAAAWALRQARGDALAVAIASRKGEHLATTQPIAWARRDESGLASGLPEPPATPTQPPDAQPPDAAPPDAAPPTPPTPAKPPASPGGAGAPATATARPPAPPGGP